MITDDRLLELAAQAVNTLVFRHNDREDAVSDVYLRARIVRDQQPDAPEKYLWRVMANRIMDGLRYNARRRDLSLTGMEDVPLRGLIHDPYAAADSRLLAADLISRVDAECPATGLIVRRVADGMTIAEAAAEAGLSVAAAKARLYRLRSRMAVAA
jgi:DNA-directed RNA polymerase specialized sigma24 family protein